MKFENAKVVAVQYSPDAYHTYQLREGATRGDLDFVMSRGELMNFALCPRRWINGYEMPGSGAKEWGSLIDVAVLDSDSFGEKYIVAPETYPDSKTGEPKPWNWNANYCKDWRADWPGKIIIKQEERNSTLHALKALANDVDAAHFLNCSKKQVFLTAKYRDRKTELTVHLKALVDLVPESADRRFCQCLGDFKSTRSANPHKWDLDVYSYNYDAQAAMYLDLWNAATGEERIEFAHLVQENVEPFEVLSPIPVLSSEFIEIGRLKYQSALAFYAQCVVSKKWPSYSPVAVQYGAFQIIQPRPHMMMAPTFVRPPEEEPEPEMAEQRDLIP